jgi:hypothetical protein
MVFDGVVAPEVPAVEGMVYGDHRGGAVLGVWSVTSISSRNGDEVRPEMLCVSTRSRRPWLR